MRPENSIYIWDASLVGQVEGNANSAPSFECSLLFLFKSFRLQNYRFDVNPRNVVEDVKDPIVSFAKSESILSLCWHPRFLCSSIAFYNILQNKLEY